VLPPEFEPYNLSEIKAGDIVVRWLAGEIPHELRVSEVTDDRIKCGAWEFCRKTGAEIDEDLNWGPPPKWTGSFLAKGMQTKGEA
jgi:hypothetical protein